MQIRADTFLVATATGVKTSQTTGANLVSRSLIVNEGDSLAIQLINGGSFVGTVAIEVSIDGTNFTALGLTPAAGGAVVTSITAAGLWTATGLAAYSHFRVNCTAFTSGSCTVIVGLGRTGR